MILAPSLPGPGWEMRFYPIDSLQLHQEGPREPMEGFQAEGNIGFVWGSDAARWMRCVGGVGGRAGPW